MRRFVTAVLALATTVLPTAAHAVLPRDSRTFFTAADAGGCRVDGEFADPSFVRFVVQGYIVSTLPVSDAWCEVLVDGSTIGLYQATVASGSAVVPPTADSTGTYDGAVISVCTVLVIGGSPVRGCTDATSTAAPPSALYDIINGLLEGIVDPLVCPLLQTVAPINISNLVEVREPDGDVYENGQLLYDCPPYGS